MAPRTLSSSRCLTKRLDELNAVPWEDGQARRHPSQEQLRKLQRPGADMQGVLMSVFFTLKKRGHNPVNAINQALAQYLDSGTSPLPGKTTSDA